MAMTPHPNSLISLNDLHLHWLYVKLLSTRTLLVLFTTSAVPKLLWKEELTFEVFESRAELPDGSLLYSLQDLFVVRGKR